MQTYFSRFAALALVLVTSGAMGQTILAEPDKIPLIGGTVKMLDGLATLIVQPNTFPENTQIMVSTNPLTPMAPELVLGSVASIGAPGFVFGKPVVLQMSYEGLSLPSGAVETDLKIFRLWNHRWSALASTVIAVDQIVQTTISVGGTYAILARASGNPPAENMITFRCTNQNASSSWRRVAPVATASSNGMAALFEELSRDADTWRGSELTPTENGVFFVRNHATGSDFYMSALNGNMPSRFTNLSFQATTGASMNPTSSVMAFTANVGGIWRLYKLSSGGTPPSVLLTLPVLPTSAPTINPVGNTVAVGTAGGAIYVYDLTTGSQVKLLATGSSADVMRVAFSPNGAKIGFITAAPSADPGTGEVGSVTVASNVVQRSSGYGRAIAWDPNSSKLAYGEREIYVWTVGSGTRTLVLNTGGQLQSLLWR